MSGDITLSRSRTWRFSHTLYTSLRPEAARGLSPTSSIDPWDFIKHMFHDLFEQGPATVSYIHLRVSRQAFDHCVACGKSGSALPDLPFSGFIQATSAVRKTILQRWLDAIWTPVGSKLCSDPHYQKEFMEPAAKTAAAFVHFLVRGEPALGVGGRGRKRKQPKDPAPPPAHDPAPAIVPPASGGKEVRPFPSCPDLFYPPLVVSLLLPFARRRQTDLRAPSRVPARTCPPFRMVPEPLRSHTRPTRGFRPPTRARPS